MTTLDEARAEAEKARADSKKLAETVWARYERRRRIPWYTLSYLALLGVMGLAFLLVWLVPNPFIAVGIVLLVTLAHCIWMDVQARRRL